MYYKELPRNILEKLQKPVEDFTLEAVSKRFNQIFQDRWRNEFSHKQLLSITIPMISQSGMEVMTAIPIWLIKNTITVPISRDDHLSRTSYMVCPIFDEESKQENEKLAFLNTAVRGFSIGLDDKRYKNLSLEKDVIGRRLFFSERVKDHIFDTEAVKVILAREEEKNESDRRNAPRKELPIFQGIPAVLTIDRKIYEIELFILDFSSSGLKIISAFDFPKDRPFTLTLSLDEEVSLWCEVVWKSVLWEDLQHAGIKFVKLHLDKFEKLCKFFEDKIPKKEEGDLRINKIVKVELNLWDRPKNLPTFLHSISVKEMRIIHPSYLQIGIKTKCWIYPAGDLQPIEIDVEVVGSHMLKEGGCLAALAINNISDDCRNLLEGFIQKSAMEERHNKK